MTSAEDGAFPARYEPVKRLGKGGGGEVWAARDRLTGRVMALKILREGADEAEMDALVREATLLSGIEGLGVPRVVHFGQLVGTERAYMVRELVEGRSLADFIKDGGSATTCLAAVVQSAELVTRLHRSLLLHGDIKPANIIVGSDGEATLVDLGLAAPWREGGTRPEGLTPRYAAPELFRGEALTPRAEVFALGATLGDVLMDASTSLDEEVRAAVSKVVERATAEAASGRYPSADEFSEALRRAAKLPSTEGPRGRVWSIVGIEAPSEALFDRVRELVGGGGLVVAGSRGSGRSTLLRRLAWSLGVHGASVILLDDEVRNVAHCLEVSMADREAADVVLLVDDADARPPEELALLDELRRQGAKLVAVSTPARQSSLPGQTFALFEMPTLASETAAELVHRMIPSLGDKLVRYIVARAGGLPGLMRTIVERLEGAAVVSIEDLERQLSEVPVPSGVRIEPGEIQRLLERGLFDQAADYLKAYDDDESVLIGLLRAKLATGRGQPRDALAELKRIEPCLVDDDDEKARWHLEKARALLRTGEYDDAEAHAAHALTRLGASLLGGAATGALMNGGDRAMSSMVSEALAISGIAQSLSARHEKATATLQRSVEVARGSGDPRGLAVALGSLAFALQRNDKLDEAQAANEEALGLAEKAGDAGHVATTRLNLAGIARMRGDVASAITHLEAAVDMGRRSGRQSTVRQALLNLANLDIYLGRLARAEGSIEALATERDSLGSVQQAQLFALEAEAAALSGDFTTAEQKCSACADAYEGLRRPVDAAEALLERVLFEVRGPKPDVAALQETLFRAEALLADSGAHRPLMLQARGQVARLAEEHEQAVTAFDQAIESATESKQQEWLWRALAARAQLYRDLGRDPKADEDRKEALGVLEQIAAELPRDLREVYWHEPRRRSLTRPARGSETAISPSGRGLLNPHDIDAPTQFGGVVREDRLARVLEINHAMAAEYDLDRLLDKIADYAIALLYAERGFVLLRSRTAEDRLSVHAARDRHGEDPHARFSQSIAERVVQTGDPFVAVDAGRDERVSDYVSVHSLMLKSVACVPIRGRGGVIGALYLETRMRPGAMFRDELPTLAAFADQSAIAIETARLVSENKQRAEELERANGELAEAHKKLEEALGRRTEQLHNTRRDLKSAKALLRGHFGYQGIVGTSTAMRKVYAVVDRVKDADVPVLITGESGTGKEVIARAIHNAGPRGKQKFVGVNCGAIPEHLLESELFGHVRGAFTGADRDKKGLFRELDQGSILLDEIGEMPPKMQAGLLRVLQEKVVRPVGGTSEEAVNTRVIAATHRDLADMVQQSTFREDLYYRLNVIQIRVPALRERLEDIPLLIDHFLRLFAARYKRDKRKVAREALKRLMDYAWPGNVRQLENVLLNAWILSDEPELLPGDFELPEARVPTGSTSEIRSKRPENVDDAKQQEKDAILEALTACNWNRAKAAKLIGMPRRTFYRRLKKYDIQ